MKDGPKQLAFHLLRGVAALAFAWAGVSHFLDSARFERMIPVEFPHPAFLVAISGAFEIIGGLCLLVPPVRRLAGCGLIALLIAVFPANVHMALHPEHFRDISVPVWADWLHLPLSTLLWIRLPLQAVFILMVWVVAVGYRDRMRPGSKRANSRQDLPLPE